MKKTEGMVIVIIKLLVYYYNYIWLSQWVPCEGIVVTQEEEKVMYYSLCANTELVSHFDL